MPQLIPRTTRAATHDHYAQLLQQVLTDRGLHQPQVLRRPSGHGYLIKTCTSRLVVDEPDAQARQGRQAARRWAEHNADQVTNVLLRFACRST